MSHMCKVLASLIEERSKKIAYRFRGEDGAVLGLGGLLLDLEDMRRLVDTLENKVKEESS